MTWHTTVGHTRVRPRPYLRRTRIVAIGVAAALVVPLGGCGPRPGHRDAGNPSPAQTEVSDPGNADDTLDEVDGALREIDDMLNEVDATPADAD